MAWYDPFNLWHQDENTRSCWGYTFQLNEEHLSPDQTHPLKFSYDTLGEKALESLDAISTAQNTSPDVEKRNGEQSATLQDQKSRKPTTNPKRDLYVLLRDHAGEDGALGKLWTEANTIPSWVDLGQVARGQDVFYRYGGPALTGLAFQSLLGGLVRISLMRVIGRQY